MKYTAPLFLVTLLLFTTSTVRAQITDESSENTKRWHFAVNAGTHYLHSHYYKYNDIDRNLNFKGTTGLWFGGNINYKINEQWYLSSEIALHSFRLAYKLEYTEPINQQISHEAKGKCACHNFEANINNPKF